MRRLFGCLLVATLLIPALAAAAGTENVRDDFGSVTYSGNDGSIDWAGPWSEGGESDGPANGQVQIVAGQCSNNKCLRMRGGLLGTVEIRRTADLADFVEAELDFDLHVDPAVLSTSELKLEVRGDGSSWTVLTTYRLGTEDGQHHDSFDLSDYVGGDLELRFRLTGLLGGDLVYIDRVMIEGPVASASTNTTTSTTATSSSSPSTTSTTTSTYTSTTSPATSSSTAGSGPSATPPTTAPSPNGSPEAPPTTASNGSPASRDDTTTTTIVGETTTSETGSGGVSGPWTPTTGGTGSPSNGPEHDITGDAPSPPTDSGIREATVGLIANFEAGLMGDMEMAEVEVLGAELSADFSLAVEAFEAAKVWIATLALVIGAAVVSGMDWRRTRRLSN